MKRLLAFGLLLAFTALCVSCSSSKSADTGNSTEGTLISGSSKELSIYIFDYDTVAKNAVEKFNKDHRNVQIKATTVSSSSDEPRSKLMYGLNNSKGPDIILCGEDTLPNLSVYFGKGCFTDMNNLIAEDKSFKWADYFEKAMDFGVFGGKRYVIPLSFTIDTMYTTKELLDKAGINIDYQDMVVDRFSGLAKKFMVSSQGKDRFFYSHLNFGTLVQTSAKQFFNLEKKTADFEAKEFGELLDKYRLLSESASTKAVSVASAQKSDLFSGGKTLLFNKGSMGPRLAAMPYDSFVTETEPVLLPAPSADVKPHTIAKPEKYIGINSKCSNVKAAYDFIKLLLSKDYQDVDMMEGIPVNREAYNQAKDNSIKGLKGYDYWKSSGCNTSKALKTLLVQLDTLVGSIDRCWTTDEYVLTLINNEVNAYLAGNLTKENAVNNIKTKVESYFKSGFVSEVKSTDDEAPVDPMKTLTLYYFDPACYINHTKDVFEQENPGMKIKIKEFNSFGDYQTQTAVELMAGGGPDIVTLHLRSFNSVYKVINSSVLCQMDDYIKRYNVLNFDDYNTRLLDGGVYNGKRYYIPLHYYNSSLHSTKKWLEENNIRIDENNWTWDKLIEYSKAFMRKPENKNKYFLSANYCMYQMLVNWEDPLIDYEHKKSYFNTDTFKKLLRIYKELAPSVAPEGYRSKTGYCFSWGLDCSLDYKVSNVDYKQLGWGEIALVPTPTLSGKSIRRAVMDEGIGVNSKCRNKEAAFKFIKIAASYDMQRYWYTDGNSNGNISLPVNTKAFSDDLKGFVDSSSITTGLAEQAIQMQRTIEFCPIRDFNFIEMIQEMTEDYMTGDKTADQVAKEIDDKVTVFLNE